MRVLVVEDERRMAGLLERGLTEDGHTVQVADTGVDGLWLATEHDFDVVVLDAMLPGLDGIAVCRELRRRQRWVPVLMLTARGDVAHRVAALDAGCDDYLPKPFSFAELGARLRAVTRRAPAARPTVLAAGTLELDPAAHAVRIDGRSIELSPREFALLSLFLRRPGEVLSRADLLDGIWDFAFEPASNVVDQYVGYVRRKIAPARGVALTTVRGVGYRLDIADAP